jgi:hypothetical protein
MPHPISSPRRGPFEAHLRDAIALNRSRAPVYARRSRGRSVPVSAALVGAELALLPVARWYDRRAERWARRGVPLLDELFASMPSTTLDVGAMPSSCVRLRVDAARIARRARIALDRRGFGAAGDRLARALDALPRDGVGCALLRHLLESALAIARRAPELCARAARAGLGSPAPLLAGLLRLHLRGLALAAALDRLAWPAQRAGVPILVADLPEPPASR